MQRSPPVCTGTQPVGVTSAVKRTWSFTVFPPTNTVHYDGWNALPASSTAAGSSSVNWSLGWTVSAFTHFWPNSSIFKCMMLMDTIPPTIQWVPERKALPRARRAACHSCPDHSWFHIIDMILGFCTWCLTVKLSCFSLPPPVQCVVSNSHVPSCSDWSDVWMLESKQGLNFSFKLSPFILSEIQKN